MSLVGPIVIDSSLRVPLIKNNHTDGQWRADKISNLGAIMIKKHPLTFLTQGRGGQQGHFKQTYNVALLKFKT